MECISWKNQGACYFGAVEGVTAMGAKVRGEYTRDFSLAGIEWLCMFADDPVSGLQPAVDRRAYFPGALAPGCVVSGFQPEDFCLIVPPGKLLVCAVKKAFSLSLSLDLLTNVSGNPDQTVLKSIACRFLSLPADLCRQRLSIGNEIWIGCLYLQVKEMGFNGYSVI